MKAIVLLAQNIIGDLADAAGVKTKKEFIGDIRRREKYAGTDALEILKALKRQPMK
jgi:hypothetical protein